MIVRTAIQQQWTLTFKDDPIWMQLDKVDIDNRTWYNVHVNDSIASWIESQDQEQWIFTGPHRTTFHIPGKDFTVNQELLALLKLTWGKL
jgi:hypothetical protein